MARLHLFEFLDQPWLPAALRTYATEYLRFIEERAARALAAFVPSLRALADASASSTLVDLCSGDGGPWRVLAAAMERDGHPVSVVLTDRFPRAGVAAAGLRYHPDPVDATDVPADLVGARTLFNGFHHLRPSAARAVLASAVDAGQPIGIFEMQARSVVSILTAPLIVLLVLLATPFIRPFRPGRLLWTYLVPITPLLIFWDGLVSMLRLYSAAELRALVAELPERGYSWDIGTLRVGPSKVPYLVGLPPGAAAGRRPD